MSILDDDYELPMVVRGLRFTSCKHALDACPYFGHEFAEVIAGESCPTRRETLIARVKVPTHRGAPRWLREINRKIERFTGVMPPPGWDREAAEREVRLVKFGMAVCRDALFRQSGSGPLRPELLSVARELRARSVKMANPLRQFYHVSASKGPEGHHPLPSEPIYEETHHAISAPTATRAALLINSTASDARVALVCADAPEAFVEEVARELERAGRKAVLIDSD